MNKQKKPTQKQIIEDLQRKNSALLNNNIALQEENELLKRKDYKDDYIKLKKENKCLKQEREDFKDIILEKMIPLIDLIGSNENFLDFFESMHDFIDFSKYDEFLEMLYDCAAGTRNDNKKCIYAKLLILYGYDNVEKLFGQCNDEQLKLYLERIDDANIIVNGKSLYEIYTNKSYDSIRSAAHELFIKNGFIFGDNITEILSAICDACAGGDIAMEEIIEEHSKQQKKIKNTINDILHKTTILPTDVIGLIIEYNIDYCKKCDFVHIHGRGFMKDFGEVITKIICNKKKMSDHMNKLSKVLTEMKNKKRIDEEKLFDEMEKFFGQYNNS